MLPGRKLIIIEAALVIALLSSKPTHAQVFQGSAPEPDGLLNGLVTGVTYDVVNQAKAERRLQHVQAKLVRDSERGNTAAVGRDLRRIESTRYRIVVDEWLIRKNLGLDPGCYPYPLRLNPISAAAIAQYNQR